MSGRSLILLGLAAALVAGCGDDDTGADATAEPSGDELLAAFRERASEPANPTGEPCFIADRSTISAIGGELGLDGTRLTAKGILLTGTSQPGDTMSCGILLNGDALGAGVVVAIADADAAQLRDSYLGEGFTEIEDESVALPAENVVAVRKDDTVVFAWTDGRLKIHVYGPAALFPPDEGYAALEAAVTGVERTLTSEEE